MALHLNDAAARARGIALGVLLGGVVGVLCGAASALFLALLERATDHRVGTPMLVWALPLAGLGIGWFYERFGASISGGASLILDRLHAPGPPIPLRMAPMVLLGTVATHWFGGSAGREGTAVQMGASMADGVATRLRATPALRRALLTAGVAGGFGSVFGTPIAGTVFALEWAALGRLDARALLPALVAALAGDWACHALGPAHTVYPSPSPLPLDLLVLLKWAVFAAAVAATTTVFIELTAWLRRHSVRLLGRLPWRMAAGGAAVVLLWQVVGTGDYLGLGVPTIVRAFHDPELPVWVFALKLLFTAITLSAGFLGGEVTPLFFIGAALGSVLARLLGLPLELGAGVGLATVFATASNSPLALSIMAVELLGAAVLPHVVWVGVLAYALAGHRGIYPAQRVAHPKWAPLLDADAAALPTLRDAPRRPDPGADR